MTISSAWPYVADALVARMRARTGYCSPVSGAAGIPVYHSVEVGLSSHSPSAGILVIGWIGDPDSDPTDPGTSGQSAGALSAQHGRDEHGTVVCRAIVHIGDAQLGSDPTVAGTVSGVLRQAFAIADDVDAMIRADPSLGLMNGNPDLRTLTAYVTEFPVIRPWLNEGIVASLEFTVSFIARI